MPPGPEPASIEPTHSVCDSQPEPVFFNEPTRCALLSTTSKSTDPSPSTSPSAGAGLLPKPAPSHAGACSNVLPVPANATSAPLETPTTRSALPSLLKSPAVG